MTFFPLLYEKSDWIEMPQARIERFSEKVFAILLTFHVNVTIEMLPFIYKDHLSNI